MSDIGKLLATDVPQEHVTTRKSGSKDLDYVTGRYVKQGLNEIFGWDGWSYEVVSERVITLDADCVRWFVHVRLRVRAPEIGHINKDGMAVGHGLLKKEIWANGKPTGTFEAVSAGRANEVIDFAAAEAVTDALKRAAVSLGQNMGLSLYPYAKGKKDIIDEIPIIKDWANAIAEAHDMEVLKFVWEQIEASDLSASGKGGLAELKDTKKADLS